MLKKSLISLFVTGALVTAANAAEVQPNGYLFGHIGQSDARVSSLARDLDAIAEDAAEFFALTGSSSYDEKDTAYKVGAGIQLNRHVAVEFQYTDLGKVTYRARGSNEFGDSGQLRANASTDGFGANLVGTLPFDRFKLFGKVGYHKLKTKARYSESITVAGVFSDSFSESDSTTEWVTSYGVGASYAFTHELELVADYERYRNVADEYHVDVATIGLRYNF